MKSRMISFSMSTSGGKGLPDGPMPRVEPNQFGNRKERRAWRKHERIANMSRKSVRTVSGGLPSLGKR